MITLDVLFILVTFIYPAVEKKAVTAICLCIPQTLVTLTFSLPYMTEISVVIRQ